MKKLLLVILIGFVGFTNAQNDCLHTVKQGETLYGIASQYGKTPADLQKENSGLSSALSLGQEIKVPCKEGSSAAETTSVNNNQADEFRGNYLYHSVAQGETIYSLSNEYGITQDQLKKDNEDVVNAGLQIGSVIKIYQKDKTAEDEVAIDGYFLRTAGTGNLNKFNVDTSKLNDSTCVNIAVMLPFEYEKNVEFLKKFKDEQEPQIYKRTRTFLELYQGIKMAVDSAVKAGLNAQLIVFDTKADTTEIRKILAQPVLKKVDLIIGPGRTNTFVYAANLLKKDSVNIPMVSPFSKKDAVVNGFPNAIRVIPSDKSHYKEIGSYVAENYLDANIIIAMQDKNDDAAAKTIQREIIAKSLLVDSAGTVIPIITEGIFKPIESIKGDKKNIIILANNKEAFSSKLTAKLIPSSSKNDLMLFGLDNIKNYKNIEVEYWDSLNIHVASSSEMKYGYPLTDSFMTSYFKKYYSEPSNYAFAGYDFTLLLLNELLYDQKYNHDKLVGSYFVGGMRDYEFKHNGGNNGITNNSVFIYKYSNFKFIKLND